MENQNVAVKRFADEWRERGSEKSEARSFWIELLQALGIEQPTKLMKFEVPIEVDDHACFIDAWIDPTRVLIEHKSRGVDLDKPARQSDGAFLTPFEQAKRYADARAYSERPKWIVVCNFVELRVYNMNVYYKMRDDSYRPNVIAVERLGHEFSRLNFLIDPDDENVDPAIAVSKQAVERIRELHKYLKTACKHFDRAALNKFCVRLMFCLYAQDAGIFEPKQFVDYFKLNESVDRRDHSRELIELFTVLDTPKDQRPSELRAELAAFPYVNGDLFKNAAGEVPPLENAARLAIVKAAEFDWIDVSPPIFGDMFESVLDDDERQSGGMHYTSIDNIHRVIDPLFLDELHSEKTIADANSNACISNSPR